MFKLGYRLLFSRCDGFSDRHYIQQGGYLIVSFQSHVQPDYDKIDLKRSGKTIEGDDVQWRQLIVSDVPDAHIFASWTPMQASPRESVLVIHIIEKKPGADKVQVTNGELYISSLLKPVIRAGVHLKLNPDDKSFYGILAQEPSYKWKLVELAYKYHQPYLQQGMEVSNKIEGCKCGVFLDENDKQKIEALEGLSMRYLLKKESEVSHALSTIEVLLIDRLNSAKIDEVSISQGMKRQRTGEGGDSFPKKKNSELTIFEQLREEFKHVEVAVNTGADLRKKRIEGDVDQPGIHFEKEYGMILPASIDAFKKLTEGVKMTDWYNGAVKKTIEEIDGFYKKYPYLEKTKERVPVAVGEEVLVLYKKLINFLPAN